ncbi:type III PLP-dependent enzyme [Actinokineospora sp.]|uniref:type III PLP-dependent enzyme n=1 Tax=Actinokineospora sp. TaxID=1872133 RepID=UPI004038280B
MVALAAEYGTPTYVYDLAAVRAAHDDLCSAVPTATDVHYSLKANPHPLVVGQLAALGCHAEVASSGEVDAAIAGGMAPELIQLAGPAKTEDTLDHALRRGIRRFSVDSPTDLSTVDRLAAAHGVSVDCLLRVNADESAAGTGLTMTGVASQFGADASWIAASPELFGSRKAARIAGLHLYAGTNLQDEAALVKQFEVSIRIAAGLSGVLTGIAEVNLGGGFGAPYAVRGARPRFPHLAARLMTLLDAHLPGWRRGLPRISFESGRYLAGDCGTLLSRIVEVKVSKGRTFVLLDAGINHLGGMSGLRRLRPMEPTLLPVPDISGAGTRCTVVGPLCTPLDTLAPDTTLADPRAGGLVSIPNVGAYGLTASLLAFLGHPAPVEIVTDAGRVMDVSRLELQRTRVAPR